MPEKTTESAVAFLVWCNACGPLGWTRERLIALATKNRHEADIRRAHKNTKEHTTTIETKMYRQFVKQH